MRETKRVKHFTLAVDNMELPGILIIERVGQQPASFGDEVVSVLRICLPTNCNGSLHTGILFGGRVSAVSSPLWSDWGTQCVVDKNTFRSRELEFTANTWREAFEQAQAFANKTLQPLLDALAARKQALLDADKE